MLRVSLQSILVNFDIGLYCQVRHFDNDVGDPA